MVVTLVLIVIKIILFFVSIEIPVTLEQIFGKVFRKLICSFQTEKSDGWLANLQLK